MSKGIVHPKFWLRHWRTRRALVGYPLYDVPNKAREADLSEAQVQENFTYFMQVREQRMRFFLHWLRDKFGVAASLTPEGAVAVDRWIREYGGGAINDVIHYLSVFETYTPTWEYKFAGHNVMIDIGIFVGEYIIWRRPELYWEIYRGHEIEPETFKSATYLKPTIGGMPRLWKPDCLIIGAGSIASSYLSSLINSDNHMYSSCSFIPHIKSSMYLSRLSDDVIFIGDSKDEPL